MYVRTCKRAQGLDEQLPPAMRWVVWGSGSGKGKAGAARFPLPCGLSLFLRAGTRLVLKMRSVLGQRGGGRGAAGVRRGRSREGVSGRGSRGPRTRGAAGPQRRPLSGRSLHSHRNPLRLALRNQRVCSRGLPRAAFWVRPGPSPGSSERSAGRGFRGVEAGSAPPPDESQACGGGPCRPGGGRHTGREVPGRLPRLSSASARQELAARGQVPEMPPCRL